MQYVCDAPGRRTWFQIETESEAIEEGEAMGHVAEAAFRRELETARQSYRPGAVSYIERDIALKGHVRRSMPLFLTLREHDGTALATAILPPGARDDPEFNMIIVGAGNDDPFPAHADSIAALSRHFAIALTPERCFPYGNCGLGTRFRRAVGG